MRKPRRKVRQRSIEWFERDVPGMHMDEVLFRQNFELVEYAVNIDFEPFTWGVRSLYKPGPV